MVERLIRWSLERRALVVAISLLVLLLGVISTLRMPVDVFPDLTAPTVTVIVESDGFAPDEMERLVTFPIESAVNGANDVRRVRSSTALGIAVVWVEFEWGTEIAKARQTVAERLSAVAGSLPRGVRAPKLAPQASILGEILFVALTSDRHDGLELRRVASTIVRRRLISEPGVAQVVPIGGETRQYQVILAPELLRAFDLSPRAVAEAIEAGNANVSPGVIVRASEESVLQGIGRIETPEDLERTVIALRGTRAVTVGDVASVRIGAAQRRGTASAARRGPDGTPIIEPAVVFGVTKQPGVNTLELTARLDAAVEAIQRSLPEGMVLNAQLFRQSSFIENAVRNTLTALVEGALFVVVVVVLFLASLRSSAITLAAIPMSLAVAILALRAVGGDINTMTLGGMAIAIGALVDDAIIDVENVVRRLRLEAAKPEAERRPAFAVVLDASIEVRASIVFATAIILLVFSPIFALSGVEGRLLQPLGVAFCVGLAASLFVALTLTPAMCLWLLPSSRTVRGGRDPWVVRRIQAAYAGPLAWAMRRPLAVLTPALALFAWALVSVAGAGRNFLPEFNEGSLVIGVTTAPGTSLAAGDALAGRVEPLLMRHEEIVAIGRRTGRAEEDEHVLGVEASEMEITLDMAARERAGKPRRTKDELLAALREDLAQVPGIQATFGQPISHRVDHMLSGSRASVAVKVFGPDLDVLRAAAAEVESAMKPVPGVVDLSIEPQTDVPAVRIDADRAALARHGASIADLNAAIEAAGTGIVATQVIDGTEVYDVVVLGGNAATTPGASLEDLLVDTPRGRVPLSALAAVREDSTPNFVNRENAERRIVVQCNVAGRDVTSLVSDVRAAIEARVRLPRGYWIEYGGQFESAAETTRRLTVLSIVVILVMAGLLAWVLGSGRDAVLVLLNLPLALIGGAGGLWLSGNVLSVASLIGFITVFGVAARNGILLVSHVRQLQRHEGVTDFAEAVRRGAIERVSPILMTALAAGLALVPLALRGDEPGSELLTPMAIVILSGLVSSTLLNMLVVPAALLRFGSRAPRGAAAVLPLALAAGCASPDPAPDWERSAGIAAETLGVESVRTPAESARSAEEALADGRLTREECAAIVAGSHPRLEAAFHEIGVARAELAQAGLLSNPAVSVFLLFPEGGGRTEIQGTIAASLSDLWRIPARERAARADLDARVLETARLAGELVLRATAAHDEALAAQRASTSARETADLARRNADLSAGRALQGAGSEFEAALASAARAVAELAAESAAASARAARAELVAALALPADPLEFELSESPPPNGLTGLSVEDLVRAALARRLDVRALDARIEALAARVPAARRDRLLDLEIALHVERPTDGPDLLGPGVVARLPVFDQGDAAAAAAESAWLAERARRAAQVREIEADLRGAFARLASAERAVGLAREDLLPRAEEAALFAADARARGDATWSTLLAAEEARARARAALFAAEAEVARARSALERAAGLSWQALATIGSAPVDPGS
ncbi:MAG: CusA/CzcA family heavy metal efflux RND transporter [Planctomycetes bacterium]|nr:CusA/CzcA family heavy metal efflux RND transporter [Planctomycetota bacterium]